MAGKPNARIDCRIWAYQEAHGAIPEEPVLFASREAAEKVLADFAEAEHLAVENNPGGLYAGDGRDEARTWGPLCLPGGASVPPPDSGALVIGVNDYTNATSYALQVDDPEAAEKLRKLGNEGDWDEVLEALDALGGGKAHIVASTGPAGTPADFLVERS